MIGCTNVANLTLCRVLDRRGEFALRASLGASRGSIVAAQLGETAILCVAGAAAGLLLTWWLLPSILAVYPAAIPADAEVRIDLRLLLSMAGVVAAAALAVIANNERGDCWSPHRSRCRSRCLEWRALCCPACSGSTASIPALTPAAC